MKKGFLLLIMGLSAFVVKAQKHEDIKNKLLLNMYKQAKEDIDKAMTNAKFTAKAEAYILKTTIYAGLATQDGTKNTPAGDQLAAEADVAFKKYREMDPEMSLVSDPIYQNGPINLYSGYYSAGYNDYSAKNWKEAYENFKKAVELSDLLINKKILTAAIDTNVLILAGVTAESSDNKEEAVKHYQRLADHNIKGEGFESVYRFLVSYYFGKKDYAAFEKNKALGKQLYPESEYFDYDKVDFAVGLVESFDGKLKALDEVLATDANNYKANQILGEIIYDTLNSRAESPVLPANAADLEKRMVVAFNNAAVAKPESEVAYLFLGDHFINKAVKVNDAREAHAEDTKKRTKPGTMASKEDVAKREALDKQYGETLEQAREPYEKACAIFAARTDIDSRTKQQYKKAASYLADIYAFKKVQSKGKPADLAKYTAEEKKWADRYDSIK